MTTLLRWTDDTPSSKTGTATFSHGNTVIQVRLEKFADARALDEFVDLVSLRGRRAARAACANYVRAAATHLEQSE